MREEGRLQVADTDSVLSIGFTRGIQNWNPESGVVISNPNFWIKKKKIPSCQDAKIWLGNSVVIKKNNFAWIPSLNTPTVGEALALSGIMPYNRAEKAIPLSVIPVFYRRVRSSEY